jgi:hypothetical protein
VIQFNVFLSGPKKENPQKREPPPPKKYKRKNTKEKKKKNEKNHKTKKRKKKSKESTSPTWVMKTAPATLSVILSSTLIENAIRSHVRK